MRETSESNESADCNARCAVESETSESCLLSAGCRRPIGPTAAAGVASNGGLRRWSPTAVPDEQRQRSEAPTYLAAA